MGWLGPVVAAIALAGGCAGSRRAPERSAAAEWSPGELRAAAAVLAGPAIERFAAVERETERVLSVTRVETMDGPRGGRTWIVTRNVSTPGDSSSGATLISRRVQTIVQDADGSIGLAREENFDDDVIVEFVPPLLIYPARIGLSRPAPATQQDGAVESPAAAFDSTIEQESFVTVHPMKHPERVRVKGPAKQKIWYEGMETPPKAVEPAETASIAVEPGAGRDEEPAARLRSVCEIDLGVSRSVNETIVWIRQGRGVVHEWRRERTEALGVKIREKTEEWELIAEGR